MTSGMASSFATDVEARFRLRVFALLSSTPALHQLILSKSNTASSARLDLARFLAAYYLGIDLARLFEQLNRCHHVEAAVPDGMPTTTTTTVLPNLMVCAELDDMAEEENLECHDCQPSSSDHRPSSSSAVWDRSRLGQLVPSECTPNFVLRLLLREQRCLEAIFFADHFHDSRTSMALRFLVDRHFPGLSLVAQYCRATLIDQLLDAIEFEECDGNEKRIHQFIEAVIQSDVLFPEEFGTVGLLNECLKAIAFKMVAQFNELLETEIAADDHSIVAFQMPTIDTIKCLSLLLPRPPIYCHNNDFGTTSTARHTLDTETRAWITLQACCSALVYALARSNRLEQLIGFFALWVGRQNDGSKSDVPFLLEAEYFTGGHSDAELGIELDIFQTLFSIALAMEMREKLVRHLAETMPNLQNANGNSNFGASAEYAATIQNCNAKLSTLATPFYENKLCQNGAQLVWPSLRRWALLANQSDIENAMLFLHTIQQQNIPTRRFLPPLNGQNRPKWCSLLLMDASTDQSISTSSNWVSHLEVFVDEEQKFKIITTDFTRLRFLAHRFQMVPLRSQPIQILLQFDPNEICAVIDDQSVNQTHQLTPLTNNFNSSKEQQTAKTDQPIKNYGEEEDNLDQLITQIRTSLDLLNGQQRGELGEDLNLRQNNANLVQNVPQSSSGDDEEHVKLIRARHHDELIKRQKRYQQRRKAISDSTNSALSSYETSRKSTSSSSVRTNRRRISLLPNKSRQNKGTSSTSSPKVHVSQEPSDEQLLNEMDTIGQRLEWIRQQFEQRTIEEQIDEDKVPSSLEEEGQFGKETVTDGTNLTQNEENNSKTEGIVNGKTKDGVLASETKNNREEEAAPMKELTNGKKTISESAKVNLRITFENAEVTTIPLKNLLTKDAETGKASKDYAELPQGSAELEKQTVESEERNSQAESAENGDSTFENGQIVKKPILPQNAETELCDAVSSSVSLAHQSPASSAGYHSSRPSTSQKYENGEANGNAEQNANQQIHWWPNAKNENEQLPFVVERMDFSGLRSSDEGEEMGQFKGKKKAKAPSWKEIEVFPRNSPVKVQKTSAAYNCSKIVPKSCGRSNDKHSRKGEAAQQMPRRSPWRRPQWLRLLPPFDGTIRTERQMAQIQHERPLLELKLDEHFSPRRRTDKATTADRGISVGTFLTNPAQCRRTFLELAAKKESRHQSQNSGLNRLKTMDPQQQKQQQQQFQQKHLLLNNGIYDSGIGLEQQQQQQHKSNNGTLAANGIVLYSVELGQADVEAMRRRAECHQ